MSLNQMTDIRDDCNTFASGPSIHPAITSAIDNALEKLPNERAIALLGRIADWCTHKIEGLEEELEP